MLETQNVFQYHVEAGVTKTGKGFSSADSHTRKSSSLYEVDVRCAPQMNCASSF